MKSAWFLKEEEYEEYKNHQKEYMGVDCDSEYMGCVRCGNLCFDILNWGSHLWLDLYVGGVNTGYGYSNRENFKNYPYDYCDTGSFKWDKDVSNSSMGEFQKELSAYIMKHIYSEKQYVTDTKVTVNLVEKAEEELKLW